MAVRDEVMVLGLVLTVIPVSHIGMAWSGHYSDYYGTDFEYASEAATYESSEYPDDEDSSDGEEFSNEGLPHDVELADDEESSDDPEGIDEDDAFLGMAADKPAVELSPGEPNLDSNPPLLLPEVPDEAE